MKLIKGFMTLLAFLGFNGSVFGWYLLDWSDPVPFQTGPDADVGPIPLDDGEGGLWLVWMRYDPDLPLEHLLMASHYDGESWTPPETVTPDSLALISYFGIDRPYGATVDDLGNLWVAWYYGDYPVADGRMDPPWGIYSRMRGPSDWCEPELVFDYTDVTPVLEIDLVTGSDGDLIMSWCCMEQDIQGIWGIESIYMAERAETGWSYIYPIAQGYGTSSMQDVFYAPALAADDSGGAWLTYTESHWELERLQEKKVWVCYFSHGTVEEQQVISGTGTTEYDPDIGVTPLGYVLVVWTTERNGNPDIYFTYRSDSSWCGYTDDVITGIAEQTSPSICCDQRNIGWVAYSHEEDLIPAMIRSRRLEYAFGAYNQWGILPDYVSRDTTHEETSPSLTSLADGSIWAFWNSSTDIQGNWDLISSRTDLLCGDANGDNFVTPADGYVILNHLGGGPYPVSYWSSDTDGNGEIHPSDGFRILNYLGVGLALECPYYE
jgi:hypothetical protein